MASSQFSSTFWHDFFSLLHRYAGVFIAPFIFVAALTGLFYILTPQVEQWLYHDVLSSNPQFEKQSLAAQIQVVQSTISPVAQITAVRPASASHDTTRIIYSNAQKNIESQAVFVDPYSLSVKGEQAVYGTSGILPFRTFLDHLHRDLLLGKWGRIYSELAASWMGILALSGGYHWFKRRQRLYQKSSNQKRLFLKWHSHLGLVLLPLFFFFSVTGLTWSHWAGDNILVMRQWLAWQTPSLMTSLADQNRPMRHSHHEHHIDASLQMHSMVTPKDFETALQLARQNGIDADKVQIRPPSAMGQAWVVEEIDRSWPTQVDSIALDIVKHKVIDHVYFEQFPLAAKLTRWGVDFHMGILFGWPNQVLLILFALGVCSVIILAYRAWWRTTDFKRTTLDFSRHSLMLWKNGTYLQRLILVLILGIAGIFLPVFGMSLLLAVTLPYLARKAPKLI